MNASALHRFALCLCAGLCAALLALGLCSCGSSSSSSSETETQKTGQSFVLGDLSITVYDQELVTDTSQQDCIAIYLHVTNNGTDEESVMGSYNVKRVQGNAEGLKVGIAYNTDGDAIHTGASRIDPGETKDVALCFVLQNYDPVTITFGDEDRGIAETTLTFSVLDLQNS